MELEYNDYRLQSVYKKVDASLKKEIIDLWVVNGAMPLAEAERRFEEVVFTIRNPAGALAGVSTVFLHKLIAEEPPFYFMRMFIRPEDRGSLGLYRLVSRKTREYLKSFEQPYCAAKGVIIIIENPKFLRKGNSRMLGRNGWNYYGLGPRGKQVWYDSFDGSKLTKFVE